jgi:hypothetical protein
MDKTKKKKGDEAEKFVAELMRKHGFITEIHPRTFRLIFINGKRIQISQDNDYHNLFDEKAEGESFMIYAQVKYELIRHNIITAQREIDTHYPHEFPYQKIQTWQVWDEWVKPEKGRRHKEFRFEIQERRGFKNDTWRNTDVRKGNWITVDISSLNEPIQKSGRMEEIEE